MASRQKPQNKEAEMSVLGCAFLSHSALCKVCEDVTEDMFAYQEHQVIFAAIRSLFEQKIPLDITTLKNELDKKKNLTKAGGLEYISEIIDSVATTANIDYYIKIIKDKTIVRNLIDTVTTIADEAYETEDDVTSLLDNAEKQLLNVIRARQTSEFQPIKSVLAVAKERLEELAQNKKTITGLETGFTRLDQVTTGLHEGELIIVAARPGMGKTAFALNLAVNAALTTNKAIAIFNLEMAADQLVNRMISSTGRIDGKKLQTGQMQHQDWKKYNEAVSQLSSTNIYIEDNTGITAAEIRAKCRSLASREQGLGLIIIDYLQLVTAGGRRPDSRQQEVSDISRAFKTMAMELKVPVIALAQLNRSAEKRENNQPMLADLRESGAIEQDADLVLFINRKDYFKNKEEIEAVTSVETDIIIAKHRKGSTGKFKLNFELNLGLFHDYTAQDKEEE